MTQQFHQPRALGRRLVERHLQCRPIAHRTTCDIRTELDDLVFHSGRVVGIETLQTEFAGPGEIGVVATHQLQQQIVARLEMVIETAGEDARCAGDFLQRCAQTRCGDQRLRGLQNLCAPGALGGLLDRHTTSTAVSRRR